MGVKRKPFQGVYNIIRFNRHFYLIALSLLAVLLFFAFRYSGMVELTLYMISGLVAYTLAISLLASWYVYDASALYEFKWLQKLNYDSGNLVVNINAGFDETSSILVKKLDPGTFVVLDFYDPAKQTEISIKRARKAYPPYPGTQPMSIERLPLENESADTIFLIFAAHEIRKKEEQIIFFKELNRVLKTDGNIIVVEHLRDLANFTVYTIGFFHFYSKSFWRTIFRTTNFSISDEFKFTPFVSTFILEKNGITS
jgi:SAM-dependent methyltransferase